MNVQSLRSRLVGLPVPQIRAFEVIGSTNDEAVQWITDTEAEDGCLVIANTQTRGRGRLKRRWVTLPDAALAFSLILRPRREEAERLSLFSPLGALGISKALEDHYDLRPQIKWPNDILLERRKVAGILVEVVWQGSDLRGVVIGIGVNVRPDAVPPADQLLFPATSVEQVAGQTVDRIELLRAILESIFYWRKQLLNETFFQSWEERLAFRNEWVRLEGTGKEPIEGEVVGIDPSGDLLLRNQEGEVSAVSVGDVHLRLLK